MKKNELQKKLNLGERNQKACNCIVCGMRLEKGEGFKALHSQKSYGYMCDYDFKTAPYDDGNYGKTSIGTEKSTSEASTGFGIEFEVSWMTEELSFRLQSLGWAKEDDCSVYREMKTPIMYGLSSLSKTFARIDEEMKEGNVSTKDEHGFEVGTHCHISVSKGLLDAFQDYTPYIKACQLLELYASQSEENEENIVNFFGRSFGSWAKIINIHNLEDRYNWFRTYCNNEHGYNIEIRLPKYKTGKQYITCVKFLRKWISNAEKVVQKGGDFNAISKQMCKDITKLIGSF